ncbi:MAG TPA: tRNA (adenosine(37)-N6)-dimethylallyltransferase MiaA [Firmicutes bacterium]|nr:tRNA (adenosine(37)-N6)-dimethylallyltransferase MiaA [Candidatus Fermentithermobacillaceae bacterium]
MEKVLVITGPTASGKSKLSLELAEYYPIEIISADSMQVYRYMDIGTDKPPIEERQRIPHHLVDIKYPDEPWSVEEFQVLARKAISEIRERGNVPCVVGGTGFYIRALLENYPLYDAPPDWETRKELQRLAQMRGNEAVHAMLRDIDPESWQTLHPNDLKRVIRAIEYYRATGRPISERKHRKLPAPYNALMIGLRWRRQELYERIDNRVEDQFQRGFVEETKRLLEMGYSEDLPSMQGLGYKEICQYLKGLTTLAETKALIKRNTRRFAKRQFTWFSREGGIIWVEMSKDKSWNSAVEEVRRLYEGWISENLPMTE